MLVEDKFASELVKTSFASNYLLIFLLIFVIFLFQIESLKRILKKFYGENSKNSTSIARIVNDKNVERISNLLKDPKVAASIVHGGSMDKEKL